jgi:nucleotide-binding universal stress UspA family protein
MCIVAAVDDSKHAARVAAEGAALAAAFDRELHLVNVLTRSQFVEIEHTSYEEQGETVPIDRVREYARQVASRAGSALDIDVTAVGLVGDVTDETLDYATEHDARYLVVGGRRRSKVGKAFFESTTQNVLLRADRPVVTVMRD